MEFIKISELINENGEFNYAKFQDKLEVKKYLSIYTKQLLIEGFGDEEDSIVGIVDRCVIENDNGYFVVDYFSKQIVVDLTLIKHYSNLELDVETVNVNGKEVNIYDYICENGVINEVKEQITYYEYDKFMDLLDETIQNKLDSENSIEASVVKVKNRLFELADKVNVQLDKFNLKELQKVGKSLIKDLNKNPEVIDRLKDILLINKEVKGEKE